MSGVEQLKALLNEEATRSRSPEIAGSVLGLIIRRHFPEVDMKREYGGLKKFIEQYCADEILWVRRNGGDHIYRHVSKGPPETDRSQSDNASNEESSAAYWTAFSNTKLEDTLVVDTTTGQLFVRPPDTPIDPPLARIQKVSRDEYRDMASRFLPLIVDPQENDFRYAVSLDDFWPHWSALLRKHKSTYEEWRKWRNHEIPTLFEKRLEMLRVSSAVAATAVANLKRRTKRPPANKTMPIRSQHLPDAKLRHVIHAAIQQMGDDDLRRIWLPIGTIVDALKN